MSETTRTYELGYLIVPTVSESQIDASVQALTDTLTKSGGTVISSGTPEFIDLAYTMEKTVASKISKYSQGYFGWVKFDADPDAMESVKKALDGNTELIRYILVKTSAQNAVIFKKPKIEAVRETAVDDLVDEVLNDEESEDAMEDHEKLPDLTDEVQSDILGAEAGTQAPAPEEGTEE